MMNELRAQLAQPFEPKHITWKPGATTKDKTKCMAMAYADLRAYMNRLDEICDMDWSVAYEPWGEDRIIAKLTIGGITRCSTGEMGKQDESNEIGGTVAEAQAFKRACAMFGMGRYLYDLPSVWIEFDSTKSRITEAGQKELDARYIQWYNRQATQKPTAVRESINDTNTPPGATNASVAIPVQPDAIFDATTPYYVDDWNKLTGKEYDLVKWVRDLHKSSDGPCTAKQYQYLTSVINGLTDNNHNYALSLLCQSHISRDNMPGAKVAAKLFDILLPTVTEKSKDGTKAEAPNANYRQDIAEMITAIVATFVPVAA